MKSAVHIQLFAILISGDVIVPELRESGRWAVGEGLVEDERVVGALGLHEFAVPTGRRGFHHCHSPQGFRIRRTFYTASTSTLPASGMRRSPCHVLVSPRWRPSVECSCWCRPVHRPASACSRSPAPSPASVARTYDSRREKSYLDRVSPHFTCSGGKYRSVVFHMKKYSMMFFMVFHGR